MTFNRVITGAAALTRIMAVHAVRTRLVFFVLVFTVVSQVLGLKVLHGWLGGAIGFVSILKIHHAVFFALFVQLFCGVLLCVVYGVWVVPYLHSGLRAELTWALPIPLLSFAMAHMMGLLLLLGFQILSLVVSFGCVIGFGELLPSVFPWGYFFSALLLEGVCFLCVMFLFATLALTLGSVGALISGVFTLSFLQLAGVLKALSVLFGRKGLQFPGGDWIVVYDLLLPVGELVFDLRALPNPDYLLWRPVAVWGAWLLILTAAYLGSISRPRRLKSAV